MMVFIGIPTAVPNPERWIRLLVISQLKKNVYFSRKVKKIGHIYAFSEESTVWLNIILFRFGAYRQYIYSITQFIFQMY